jgi:FtsH-binding integral membrane protein
MDRVEGYRSDLAKRSAAASADRSLRIVLWTLWVLAVAGTALLHWRADAVAQRPVNLLGLMIYTALSGLIGLVVMTIVEMWLEPQRFLE